MNKAEFAMATNSSGAAPLERGRVNLRTLVLIRWSAVAGQAVTLLFVHYSLGFDLPLMPTLGVVAISALLNLSASLRHPPQHLDQRAATLYLSYDLVQLGALLFLTGGLQNPFAVLLLAPVTVGASILSLHRLTLLGFVTLLVISGLAIWHLALPWIDRHLDLPTLYIVAVWLALAFSTVFIGLYLWNVAEDSRRLDEALTATHMALAREQRVSAVGALAAAAAHELGSPLGTIAVIAGELARDLPEASPHAEDARLLLSETARCRTILAELASRPDGDAGSPFEVLPVSALIEAAGDAHRAEFHHHPVTVSYDVEGDPTGEPLILRHPEMIHGIGNLIQNAIQFASRRVEVTTSWDRKKVTVEIADDGPGFPPNLLTRLGEPYLSQRGIDDPDGTHMGLGIFIAETLLRRTGAEPAYQNTPQGGALVRLTWLRARLETVTPSEPVKNAGILPENAELEGDDVATNNLVSGYDAAARRVSDRLQP